MMKAHTSSVLAELPVAHIAVHVTELSVCMEATAVNKLNNKCNTESVLFLFIVISALVYEMSSSPNSRDI